LTLKRGKEEIIYLLNKAIEKFEQETGKKIVQNTNRKNYEELSIVLSEISNALPYTAEQLGHSLYPADPKAGQQYPFRKYDITGGQIKDALMGLVANPRSFLVDTCYIYNYGVGRLAFEKNPIDPYLFENPEFSLPKDNYSLLRENQHLKLTIANLRNQYREKWNSRYKSRNLILLIIVFVLALFSLYSAIAWQKEKKEWLTLKQDFNILPYKVTKAEIDSLEGVWLCYTGSPQARISDPSRYHKVVTNLVEIKYKDGYFTYNRFGASFNHTGYIQFESPGIVSVYSRIKNNSNTTESPRHSLLNLSHESKYLSAISASWNFDVGDKNKIIGIREIYIKLGKGGTIDEVMNEIENASCQCKVIRWRQDNNQVQKFYLKNQLLDSLDTPDLKPLINERSILLGIPQEGLVISKDSTR